MLLSLFIAVACVTILLGPFLLDFLSFGVADPVVRADQRAAGWLLLVLLVPQVVLYAVAGVGMAVQHGYGRYRLATAAYTAENFGVVAVVISSGFIFGSGVAVGDATTAHLIYLGAGTTAAVALHAGVQWWGAWRVGMVLRPRLGWRSSPEFRGLLSLCVPSLGYAGMNALRLITLIAVANSIPGGVVAFQMAMAFYYLPIAVGARPVAWAMVPHLARVHEQGPQREFQSEWARGFAMSAFVVVPALLGYAVLSTPLARAFSLGEMSTTTGVGLVAAALLPLAFGIPGETMFIHASHGLYARSDARRPLRGMALRVGLTFVGIVLTASFVDGTATMVALGCTVAVADLIGGTYLASRIIGGAGEIQRKIGAAVGRSAIGAAIMAIPVYVVGLLSTDHATQAEELIIVLVAVGLGAAVYLALQRLVFHSPELRLFSAQLSSLFRRDGP